MGQRAVGVLMAWALFAALGCAPSASSGGDSGTGGAAAAGTGGVVGSGGATAGGGTGGSASGGTTVPGTGGRSSATGGAAVVGAGTGGAIASGGAGGTAVLYPYCGTSGGSSSAGVDCAKTAITGCRPNIDAILTKNGYRCRGQCMPAPTRDCWFDDQTRDLCVVDCSTCCP